MDYHFSVVHDDLTSVRVMEVSIYVKPGKSVLVFETNSYRGVLIVPNVTPLDYESGKICVTPCDLNK
jgi:hypothetical protein